MDIQAQSTSTDTQEPRTPVDFEITVACRCREHFTLLFSALAQRNACPKCGQTIVTVNPIGGWVYVLKNVRMPGLVKIGQTSRPVAERLAELNAPTSVPEPFYIRAIFAADDPVTAEREIHGILAAERLQSREFFEISDEMVLDVCQEICGRPPFVVEPDLSIPPNDASGRTDGRVLKINNKVLCPKCQRKLSKLNGGKNWRCNGCDLLFDNNGVAVHRSVRAVVTDDAILCPKCQEALSTLSGARGWQCEGCKSLFDSDGLAV